MAEIKDKLVSLKILLMYKHDVDYFLQNRLKVPSIEGNANQVLTSNGDGTYEWKDPQATSASVEADIRRIINEQLAKTKFTINDQGHLIIETPEA